MLLLFIQRHQRGTNDSVWFCEPAQLVTFCEPAQKNDSFMNQTSLICQVWGSQRWYYCPIVHMFGPHTALQSVNLFQSMSPLQNPLLSMNPLQSPHKSQNSVLCWCQPVSSLSFQSWPQWSPVNPFHCVFTEHSVCPVIAKDATFEYPAFSVMVKQAIPEPSACPVTANEAISEFSACPVTRRRSLISLTFNPIEQSFWLIIDYLGACKHIVANEIVAVYSGIDFSTKDTCDATLHFGQN